MSNITVTIAIITYNRAQILERSVQSILNQENQPEAIVVIDSSDTPLSADHWIRKNNLVAYTHSQERLFAPQARNVALAQVATEIVMYLEDDAVLNGNVIPVLKSRFNDRSLVGLTGPTIDVSLGLEPLYPIIRNNRSQIRVLPWGEVRSNARQWVPEVPVRVDSMQGANMSFRTKDLRTLGGFDEVLDGPAFREETDMCLRVKTLYPGAYIECHPGVSVLHIPNVAGGITDIEDDKSGYFEAAGANHRHFSDKHFPKILSRASWVLWSRNPPSLVTALIRTLFGKYNYLAWHRGLWRKLRPTTEGEME